MQNRGSKLLFCFMISFLILSLSGCSGMGAAGSTSVGAFSKASQTPAAMPTATQLPPTETPIPLPTNTPEPTFTPTPVVVQVSPGEELTVPILLYHHIGEDGVGNRYYVSTSAFQEQMRWLYEHHYQTITISQLADLILYGGEMPLRPVVITFDDGDADMVENALPVLQKYGFVATSYVIARWIDAPHFITSDQVLQLSKAGWEIGSHSMSHVDLTQNEGNLEYEVRDSLLRLNQNYGLAVKSFAYPFGMINANVVNFTARAGYAAAVGLGISYKHGYYDLFYLSRMEVRQEYTLDQFIALLPWND